ncbi:hypothetical protein BCR42DRAFT_99941 [Absidia repens]|uniref:Attractin/MKLN-like beta-propeller domain-containing protein n=1 Tax=Absidia repens TaxID=90262 RepID=A0A1X2I816_9FUNG|nr:hypothetical protein BCR42DRAFT_99941 [Absidia repens]
MFYLFYLLLFIECAVADQIAPRAFQGCVLNVNEIHCYGGFTHQPAESVMQYTNASNDHFYLSIDTLDFSTLSSANAEQQHQWQYVARPAGHTVLPPLANMAMTAIASQTQFILYGGVTEPASKTLTDPLWKCSTNLNNSMSTPPSQEYYTLYSPVVDTRASTIWTWGGLINTTGIASINSASTFDYAKEKWNTVDGDRTNSNIWIKHTAVFIEKTGLIYMMGGYELKQGEVSSTGTFNNMTNIRWFDTFLNTWGMDQATVSGNQHITSRILHTVTPIPDSNKLLVYGGYNDQEAKLSQDYVYVYDFVTKEYTSLNFNQTGPGPRASHSGFNRI